MTCQTKKLDEICEISSGNSAPQKDVYFIGGKFPFFRTSDVGSVHISQNLCETRDYLNEKGIKGMNLYKKGTILFPKSGASTFLNHRVMMGCDGYVSSHLATIKANKNLIDENYLFDFLLTVDAKKIGANSAYPSLKVSDISNFEIPLPPLLEQKKIVKILDAKMDKIAEAKRLREETLADTEKIISQTLREIFEEGENKRWEEKELGEVLEKIVGGGTPSKSNPSFWNGEIPWASVKDLKEGQRLIEKTRDFITHKGLENSSANLIPKGSLIISTRMGLGRVAKNTIDLAINQDLKALFPKKIIDIDFLTLILLNKAKEIISGGKGATVSGIKLDFLRKIKIILPPLSEQQKIVKKLDALSAKIRQTVELQKSQLEDLKKLEKAYLREAFNGELI